MIKYNRTNCEWERHTSGRLPVWLIFLWFQAGAYGCFTMFHFERSTKVRPVHPFAIPVDTRRRFNVYKTSIRRRWRRIDVLQTLKRHHVPTGIKWRKKTNYLKNVCFALGEYSSHILFEKKFGELINVRLFLYTKTHNCITSHVRGHCFMWVTF